MAAMTCSNCIAAIKPAYPKVPALNAAAAQ
jgi:hypothetical protein